MASTGDSGTGNPAPAPRQRNEGGRGKGRGRRGGANGSAADGESRSQNNRGGRRGGSRGRGGNTMNTSDLAARFSQPTAMTTTDSEGGNALPEPKTAPETADDDVEAEVCFICASPVVHNSVAPCNHRTCHICALRMRALYKTKDCAHCRTAAPYVIFTDDAEKRFQDFTEADITSKDDNIGIRYENTEIVEDTLLLLRYNCPDPSCDIACLGWPDLHRHVKSVHHKKMCDLCTRNKKVFTHEHELFTDRDLDRHMKKGDDNPGAVDQSGFKGHPLCGFCGQRFYGDDELYVHCRQKHERCFICDRAGGQPQYYVNYDALEMHFRKDHYMCPERECQEKKFIVFSSEMDLKAHQLEEHRDSLSKDVRRDARIVDLSSFEYRQPYQQSQQRGNQREGRGRGRGRDPNAEPIPASSAQPMRRDEQAFQRQMAVHSAQSVSTRTFGGQLTQAPQAARPPPGAREPPTVNPRPSANAVASQMAELNVADLSPQEQARRLRHGAVIDRASTLLNNDPAKMTQFRNSISSFRSNSISANALIDAFFALFDTSASNLGTLIREVADIYEDKAKADSLRTAWNDWRAINEDYPSLPGPSGMSGNSLPAGWASVTSKTPSANTKAPRNTSRVLKLKSSTAQSSRSSVSQNASWGSVPPASSSSSTFPAFPDLPSSSSSRQPTPKVSTTPWVAPSAPSSAPSSARPTPPSSRPGSTRPGGRGGATGDMFPALPPAAKPQSTIFGYGSGMVRRDNGKPSGNFRWGESSSDAPEEQEEVQTKKKGKKGKQVLVAWG